MAEITEELKTIIHGVIAEVKALKQQADLGAPAGDVTLLHDLALHLEANVDAPQNPELAAQQAAQVMAGADAETARQMVHEATVEPAGASADNAALTVGEPQES